MMTPVRAGAVSLFASAACLAVSAYPGLAGSEETTKAPFVTAQVVRQTPKILNPDAAETPPDADAGASDDGAEPDDKAKREEERGKREVEKQKREADRARKEADKQKRGEDAGQADTEKPKRDENRARAGEDKQKQDADSAEGEADKQKRDADAAKAEADKLKADVRARVEAEKQKREEDRARAEADKQKQEEDRARAGADKQKQDADAAKAEADKQKRDTDAAKAEADKQKRDTDAAKAAADRRQGDVDPAKAKADAETPKPDKAPAGAETPEKRGVVGRTLDNIFGKKNGGQPTDGSPTDKKDAGALPPKDAGAPPPPPKDAGASPPPPKDEKAAREEIDKLKQKTEQEYEKAKDERRKQRQEARGDRREAPDAAREKKIEIFEKKFEDLREQRRERVEAGGRVVIEEPDKRKIFKDKGRVIIQHDETERFRKSSRDVRVERRNDGTTASIIVRPGGVQIINIEDRDGRLLRRVRKGRDGREVVLIDNGPERRRHRPWSRRGRDRDRGSFFDVTVNLPPPVIRIPRAKYVVEYDRSSEEDVFEALSAPPVERLDRSYTLEEVRRSYSLRERMRRVDLDAINFEFGSWEVENDQYPKLEWVTDAIKRVLERNPDEVFMIEGHTDAVGSEVDNLSLSDRRAESVAVIMTDVFNVPPENLVTQGYGEEFLKINTPYPERQNRRVAVRRITPLLSRYDSRTSRDDRSDDYGDDRDDLGDDRDRDDDRSGYDDRDRYGR